MSLRLTPSQPSVRGPILAMVTVALVRTVWQHQAWKRQRVSLPEYVALLVVTPIETRLSRVFSKLHDFGLAATQASRLSEEARRLREERDELEALRILTINIRAENKDLRQKLGLEPGKTFEKVAAQVISRSSSRSERWVRIRTADGKPLEVGNVVREALGLVGRVVEAEGDVGRVVLLVDDHHAVRGKDLQTGEEGMVYAANELEYGPNRLRLEKTRRGARIKENDVIVTSELGETYPGGVPIGEIESVRRSPSSFSSLVAVVKPYVDFEALDYVYVLRAGEH